ncbi:hypothetical protein MNBD_BACTEROID07-1674 [hydrothermal vent metagenome]|uniref:R3H domain-containing protein n=1 Tax=hydrothermal vent metagenome TaxID=652676 RepID=A0A3B0U9X1_9ZZZZ
MEDSIIYAKKYLEDLLSFFGLNTDIRVTREEDVIELSVPSSHLNGFLIGNRGDTLRALQYLVSSALRNQEMELTRVNVDIADYKKQRNDRLAEKALGWVRKVRDTKEEMALEPMNPADRRVVHKAVSELSGVETESHGEGRDRHIVLTPKKDKPEEEDDYEEPALEDGTSTSDKETTEELEK